MQESTQYIRLHVIRNAEACPREPILCVAVYGQDQTKKKKKQAQPMQLYDTVPSFKLTRATHKLVTGHLFFTGTWSFSTKGMVKHRRMVRVGWTLTCYTPKQMAALTTGVFHGSVNTALPHREWPWWPATLQLCLSNRVLAGMSLAQLVFLKWWKIAEEQGQHATSYMLTWQACAQWRTLGLGHCAERMCSAHLHKNSCSSIGLESRALGNIQQSSVVGTIIFAIHCLDWKNISVSEK